MLSLIYIVPTGLSHLVIFVFYRYCVPTGLSRQGQYIGRKEIKMSKKSRRDDIKF